MKHLTIIALFLTTTTACGSSTTVISHEPIGNAGNPGIEETGGSAGSIGQAGAVNGGSVGTTGGTGNSGTGGNSTGSVNAGGNPGTGGVENTDYVLPATCRLIQYSADCVALYEDTPSHPIQFKCDDTAKYPTTDQMTVVAPNTYEYWIPATNADNPSIRCYELSYAMDYFCCNVIP